MYKRRMKNVFCFLFFFGFLFQSAFSLQPKRFDSTLFVEPFLIKTWLYSNTATDDDAANPKFDDRSWDTVRSDDTKNLLRYTKPAWYRYHFTCGSDIFRTPLAFAIDQKGISEIYLDGKLIIKYGIYKSGSDPYGYDPQNEPVVFTLSDTGEHVIAVKYLNPFAVRNAERFGNYQAGFVFTVGKANGLFSDTLGNYQGITFVFMSLFGLFFALGLLHLFIYLFNRNEQAHIYYSIFSLSIACIFFIAYLSNSANSAEVLFIAKFLQPIVWTILLLSLSRFINELFPVKNKYRKWLIVVLAFFTIALRLADSDYAALALISLSFLVVIESLVLVIYAIIKKHRGAKIIGFGILFTISFVTLLSIGLIISQGEVDISNDTMAGQIIFYLVALAIVSIPLSMSVYLAWEFNDINRNLKSQLVEVQRLSEKTISQEKEKMEILEGQKEALESEVSLRTREVLEQKQEIEKQHAALVVEKGKSDNLLLNILPGEIAEELKNKGHSEARLYDNVTVLFTDFVNFTKLSEHMTPQELVSEIDYCFKGFDVIISELGIEKIKTIGDAYLAVSGLPVANDEHAIRMVQAALKIRDFMALYKARRIEEDKPYFDLRFGIHSGPVVAGIVGTKKFAFDIWGDTVNTAARMEQSGETGKINISAATFELIKDSYHCEYRGLVNAKNKGAMEMYFVETSIIKEN